MAVRFEQVGRSFELASRPLPGKEALSVDLHGAKRLFASTVRDGMGIRHLRAQLAMAGGLVSRMTDAEVIEHLATRVAMRRLYLYAEPVRRLVTRVEEPAAEVEALGPLPESQVEEPADDSIDAPAQVAALKEAARDGTPFCEECEKARLREEAAAAAARTATADPFAATDVAAQAEAMRAAAAAGVPFCEECAKAA
jgi:hypothetical protein